MIDLKMISSPAELKALPRETLPELAKSIQTFLIETTARTGGHIGANLGVVELSIALHRVFNSPVDKIVFDTGHQGYTHKIITGRLDMFGSLNTTNGMSRFITREESEHDIMDASHAGTSISTAVGLAEAHKLAGLDAETVAIIGDGSMVEGLAWEGLNHAAVTHANLIIVINDNGMAIAPNTGGLDRLFKSENWRETAGTFFSGMGFRYLSTEKGHDVAVLEDLLTDAKKGPRPVVVHVKTEKGHGLEGAAEHPYKMHFSMRYDVKTLKPLDAGSLTYAQVAGDTLHSIMKKDKKVVAICPATPYASKIEKCLTDFPDRAIDVGMAEQHVVCYATGLALGGYKPVCCFQSTFMQRAMDQIIHDASFMNLPVTLLVVRCGFSGFDGPTHQGLFDLSYMRAFPNLTIFYPKDQFELRRILTERMADPQGPMAIMHPYDTVREGEVDAAQSAADFARAEVLSEGKDGCILAVGNRIDTGLELVQQLADAGQTWGLVNIRWLKPLPEEQLSDLIKQVPKIITLEESMLINGFGTAIAELVVDRNLNVDLLRSGIVDHFVPGGVKDELSILEGIDSASVLEKARERWGF